MSFTVLSQPRGGQLRRDFCQLKVTSMAMLRTLFRRIAQIYHAATSTHPLNVACLLFRNPLPHRCPLRSNTYEHTWRCTRQTRCASQRPKRQLQRALWASAQKLNIRWTTMRSSLKTSQPNWQPRHWSFSLPADQELGEPVQASTTLKTNWLSSPRHWTRTPDRLPPPQFPAGPGHSSAH